MRLIARILTLLVPNLLLVVGVPLHAKYFTAAVFEHARRGDPATDTPAQIIKTNLDYYKRATAVAKSKGADIIVFPEYGVVPFRPRDEMKNYLETVPNPKKGTWNPCFQKHLFSDKPMLYTLSCMSRQYKIVVVANIGDIQPCTSDNADYCPKDKTLHFNANVVFDRNGTLLSRYRKEHLFFEPGMDLPKTPQDPIFKTDFGTFAAFICFDAIFKHIVDVASDNQVDGIFLPTMWMDMMPLGNAVQYWQGWAIGNKINFITANAQIPREGAVGSGVFTGGMGALKYTFNPDGQSKLLVSRVPMLKNQTWHFRNPNASITIITSNGTKPYDEDDIDFEKYIPEYCSQSAMENGKDYRCTNQNTANFTLIKITEPQAHLEACNNGMCCTLDYSTGGLNDTFYFAIANTTQNIYNHYFWCEEVCMVVRCDSLNGKGCSLFPTKSSTYFHRLELRSNFTTPFVYPSVVRTGMRLASMDEWWYNVQGENSPYESSLIYKDLENKPLLVAALNGRCYDRDPPYVR